MGLLDSNTVNLIEQYLTKDVSMENFIKQVPVTFSALGIANGHELDDEELIQEVVNNICIAKGWTATIVWTDCLVFFSK